MRLARAILTAALLLAAPTAAYANKLDLATVTCKDFIAAGKDNVTVIITWLDGYYKGKGGPPVIDFDKFKDNSANLGKYCGANPTASLINAANQTLGK